MEIKDYVVLRQVDAQNSTIDASQNTLIWHIPASYYSNQRSTSCSVSLIDAFGQDANSNDEVLSVRANLTATNQYNSANSNTYLGKLPLGKPSINNAMKLMTTARPTQIEFKLINETQADGLPVAAITGCIFVLEFCYYNSVDTANHLVKQFTPTII